MKHLILIFLMLFALNGAAQTADTMTAGDHLIEYAKLKKQGRTIRGVSFTIILLGVLAGVATETTAPIYTMASIGLVMDVVASFKDVRADRHVGRAGEKLRAP